MADRCPTCGQLSAAASCYQTEVAYTVRTLKTRGRIYEGCRAAFESGEYHDENLARMIAEGVIVPDPNPAGGYVLPKRKI
jgi:hypothetical protein